MKSRWYRAKDGALFGVCKGLADALHAPVGIVRLFWLACALFGGVGIWFYILLAIALPRQDKIDSAYEPRVLGVCSRLARRIDVEVGLVRLITLILFLGSFGIMTVLYLVGHFLLDQPLAAHSRNNPSSPPSTT